MEEILKKIGQIQYEISCLELDEETLTGVTIRIEELKELVKNCALGVVSGRSELLNHDIKVGDTVLRTTKTQHIVSAFCEDGMIELEDGCDYFKVDREEIERVV